MLPLWDSQITKKKKACKSFRRSPRSCFSFLKSCVDHCCNAFSPQSMVCLVPAPREALKKCRSSTFIMISPNVNERVKITKGWQPHEESGCASYSAVLTCSSPKVDFYNWLRKDFFRNPACCLSPSLFISHTRRKTEIFSTLGRKHMEKGGRTGKSDNYNR